MQTHIATALAEADQVVDWMLPVGIAAGVLVLGGLAVVVVRAVRSRRADED